MKEKEAQKRIKKLKELIRRHRYLYHVLDKPELSDSAFDSLKRKLFQLEKEYPRLITPDSPTQRVGGKPLDKFKKFKHPRPMLSFNDAFSREEMKEWEERLKKLLAPEERRKINYFAELKFDGLAIELVYEKGILKVGATRGDGKTGEDVTQNLKTIEAIPLKLRNFEERVVVRGECLISKKEFQRINRERKEKGLASYSNTRNTAAGSIRQLNPKIVASRNLDAYFYDLVSDLRAKTHREKHKTLKELGFKVHKAVKLCSNLKEVFEFQRKWEKEREKLPFEIDGVVVQVNNNDLFQKLGVVGKAPRGAIAYKFVLRQAETEIKDIKVQVGRTGAVTPIAYLKPVNIEGVTISRATLHNEDEIGRLGAKIGDTVIVGRAGDVIPDIVKVLPDLRTGKEKVFKMPDKCPICGTKLKKDGVILKCPNNDCRARQRKYFHHFVSKKAFDIEGLGPQIINQLLEKKLINDPADLFNLKEGDLLPLEGFDKKSADNLLKAIKESREISWPKFIYALGIPGVGEETAVLLANNFNSLAELKKAERKDLETIHDIGPEVSRDICNYFQKKENFPDKLLENGVKIKSFQSKGRKLKGRKFVLTGTLKSLTRDEAKNKIRSLGGKTSNSVSSETDYLVIGENPGSTKLEEAKKEKVKVLEEKKFLGMLGE